MSEDAKGVWEGENEDALPGDPGVDWDDDEETDVEGVEEESSDLDTEKERASDPRLEPTA